MRLPSEKRAAALLMLHTVHLATALDEVSARDWPDSIAATVHRGNLKLAELVLQRESIALASEDAPLIDWLFSAIRARLKFLERFCRCNLPN